MGTKDQLKMATTGSFLTPAHVKTNPSDGAPASGAPPAPQFLASAQATPSQPSTKEEQAREAWNCIAKPVTEASFVAWYCATHNKKTVKRSAASQPSGAPESSKRPTVLPAEAGASSTLTKGKRTALLKGLVTVLKKSIKAERWHVGDGKSVSGSAACDPAEFRELFSHVELASSGGVLTTFRL